MSVVLAVLIAAAAGIWYFKILKQNEELEKAVKEAEVQEELMVDTEPQISEEEQHQKEVEEIVDSMTLGEKVAQLFIVTPESLTDVEVVTAAGNATQKAINEYPVGGFIYMAQNLETPKQVKKMVSNVQDYSEQRSGLPMFINVDEEGGTVTRFCKNSSNQTLSGAWGDGGRHS